jgi:hypothetical protein
MRPRWPYRRPKKILNKILHQTPTTLVTSPFSISENSKNIWRFSLIYLWTPRALFIFFFAFCIFLLYAQSVDHAIKCKICCPTFLLFLSKNGAKNKKKGKKMALEKFFFKLNFLWNYSLTSESEISHLFWLCAIFTNVIVENIHRNHSLTLESWTW